ncbi:glycosyltransferase family 4 protein [Arthrobacter sp. 92]|uniref:glycosyltransferase family 4 protein n=1 Tax=Arthrobacter sp. 92 TaxID=3418175 RepID=UPI003D07D37C
MSTSWAASSFVSHYRVDPEGVKIVGIGHRQRQRSASASRQWSHPRYLFVGVDWKRKNGAAVVAAFRRVHSMVPTATLHLVGGIPHIDEPGVVSHGLLPRGDARAQRTLDSLYASATCFVLPSRFEPAGIAYLEAGSAGLPVIATTQGGASELLESGALPVSPYDVGAITDAMMTAASGDKAEHMGELAAKAAAKSSWEKVASRILAGISFAQENAYVGSTS